MDAPTNTRPSDQRRLLWPVAAVSVVGTAAAVAFTRVGAPIAVAIGALLALTTVGWWLWRAAPDPRQAKSNLGTGLLVSILAAAVIGSAQLAIDDRRQRSADRENLRITVGLQRSLAGIDLGGRDLTRFYFAGKNLQGARFEHAILFEANLERANLRYAAVRGGDLRHALLFEADLREASLVGADLGEAEANGALLGSADLRGAQLGGTKLQAASLRGAFLERADLRGADLRAADIRRTSLRGANLGGADLSGANLRGTDLRATNLRATNLRGAIVDSRTRWPAGFDRGAAGA